MSLADTGLSPSSILWTLLNQFFKLWSKGKSVFAAAEERWLLWHQADKTLSQVTPQLQFWGRNNLLQAGRMGKAKEGSTTSLMRAAQIQAAKHETNMKNLRALSKIIWGLKGILSDYLEVSFQHSLEKWTWHRSHLCTHCQISSDTRHSGGKSKRTYQATTQIC